MQLTIKDMKQKAFRLPRKVLTEAEAMKKKSQLLMQIQNLSEEILYWKVRLNKPLDPIDNFILMADNTVKTPEDVIKRNTDKIERNWYIIDNYCHLYCNRNQGLI